MATVSVRGRGVTSVRPDELTVGLTVQALRPRASEAFAEAGRLAEQLVALCAELAIEPGSRATSNVSLSEHGEHTDRGWQHRGYLASCRLAVRLEDAELASRLVTEAAERLEIKIDGPAWRVAHDNPGRAEARRLAAQDARQRAEEYAAALGSRVGAVVAVAEPETKPERLELAALARSADMPLEAGQQELVAVVDVTFQLEQP
ncbi:MAG TPA: SIMPL domain-containing protein [Gaiella sp.]|nr:SIMPL domain-containing protein [Gaiella sp.]